MSDDAPMTPVGEAINTLNTALQVLDSFRERSAVQALQMDASEVRRMLTGVAETLSAAERTMEGQQEQLRDMRNYNLEQERRITELQKANEKERARLVEIAEDMKRITYTRIDNSTQEHQLIGIALANLTRHPMDFPRPLGVDTTDEPRIAAAGGR